MDFQNTSVGLLSSHQYQRKKLKEQFDTLSQAIGFSCSFGSKILLKPNLVSVNIGYANPACTHPEFIAAAAEWFLDHGARVSIGDSPAFGTARQVLKMSGALQSLDGLPVRYVNFSKSRNVELSNGVQAGIAVEALDCDILVNLPKVKAHSQFTVTLAIKNYFGSVAGLQKPWWHMRYGDKPEFFAALLVDLLNHLPEGLTLIDGIQAMHRKGPTGGDPFNLHVVGASCNPVALDRAIHAIIGLDGNQSEVMRECRRRTLPGAHLEDIHFPLAGPSLFCGNDFELPVRLKPVSFNPVRMGISAAKRLWDRCFPGSRR